MVEVKKISNYIRVAANFPPVLKFNCEFYHALDNVQLQRITNGDLSTKQFSKLWVRTLFFRFLIHIDCTIFYKFMILMYGVPYRMMYKIRCGTPHPTLLLSVHKSANRAYKDSFFNTAKIFYTLRLTNILIVVNIMLINNRQ